MNRKLIVSVAFTLFFFPTLSLLTAPQANAWFGNSQCKKAKTAANKAYGEIVIMPSIIINNKKCFEPSVVAMAQACAKAKPSMSYNVYNQTYLDYCYQLIFMKF